MQTTAMGTMTTATPYPLTQTDRFRLEEESLTMVLTFWISSFLALGAGLLVVTNRNLFHAALALMVSFLGVAGIYLSLDAGFLAAAQLLIYIGAISILIIFAIMLTRRMMQTDETPYNSQRWLSLGGAVVVFAILFSVLIRVWPLSQDAPVASVEDAVLQNMVVDLGRAFVGADAYVIPFELASILLLAALVGAIVVAWPKTEEPL
ncbi:MAG: NADH-quinone oxidoreductase subunit J [Chloroflexota bacterium]